MNPTTADHSSTNFDSGTPGVSRTIRAGFFEGHPVLRLIARSPNDGRGLVFGTFLVDTGANMTNVEDRWVRGLRLASLGTLPLHTATTGDKPHTSQTYLLDMFIPNQQQGGDGKTIGDGLMLHSVKVTSSPMPRGSFDGLIGRDVLKRCRLNYDGPAQMFSLSY